MSSTVSSPTLTQYTRLPSVVTRQSQKKDFTYTFQRVAPILFFFMLGLSIYTKYRMNQAAVVPVSKEALQAFSPAPWEKTSPSPYIDANFGESKWEELKQSLSNAKDTVQEKVAETKKPLEVNWEGLKELGRQKIMEKMNQALPTVDSVADQGQATINQGKAKIAEVAELGKEKLAEATELGKDSLADAKEWLKGWHQDWLNERIPSVHEVAEKVVEKASEIGLGAMDSTKQFVNEKIPIVQETAEHLKEKATEVTEKAAEWINDKVPASVQEKVDQVKEKASEIGLGAMDSTKEWVSENLPSVQETAGQFMHAAADRIERFMEGGEAYVSPVYYGPESPAGFEACANQSRPNVMPW